MKYIIEYRKKGLTYFCQWRPFVAAGVFESLAAALLETASLLDDADKRGIRFTFRVKALPS